MIKKIGCIAIPVSNMNKSVEFYEKILGLKKDYAHPVWTEFDIGGTPLGLYKTKEKSKGAASGNYEIYLAVDDIQETYRQLKGQGVKFATEPVKQSWGGITAEMLDPDENTIVLTQYPK